MMKISVITINFNNREGLRRTIKSVLSQTFNDIEYIVIDGGSTDGSVGIIKEYASQIDYWVSEPDRGIYNAMNKGIKKAHGEYLNFMNSGDSFHDCYVLQRVYDSCKGEDILIGQAFYSTINQRKEFIGEKVTMMYLLRNHPAHQASFIKRELFDMNLYDESFVIISDWLFFIQTLIFQNRSCQRMDFIIVDYDMEGISSTNPDLYEKEELCGLKKLLPERILKDYLEYKYMDSPLLELIPDLNRTAGFGTVICRLVKSLLRIYKLVRK